MLPSLEWPRHFLPICSPERTAARDILALHGPKEATAPGFLGIQAPEGAAVRDFLTVHAPEDAAARGCLEAHEPEGASASALEIRRIRLNTFVFFFTPARTSGNEETARSPTRCKKALQRKSD